MGYSGKTFKQGGLKTYSVVRKKPRNLKFCYFTLQNFGQKESLAHGSSTILCFKTCYTPKIPRPKIKTLVSHKCFLIMEFSLVFQFIPGNFMCFFLITLESVPLTPLFCFFWNSPMNGANS